MKRAEQRPTYIVAFRPELHVSDPVKSLRGLLKLALRRFGLRCISVHPADEKKNTKVRA